jgi:hypothetical protein
MASIQHIFLSLARAMKMLHNKMRMLSALSLMHTSRERSNKHLLLTLKCADIIDTPLFLTPYLSLENALRE